MFESIVITVVLLLFLYLLVMGQFISSLLLTVGMIGIYLLGGLPLLDGFIQSEPFNRVASYSLTTIPLYILMAQFILQAGIIKDLYNLVFRISRGKQGVLGVLTVFIGGLLGGVSGSGTATSAALGQIAVPELKRRGYPDGLAGTLAAVSGSLSAIIPPSVILILYGVVAQISIGQLFAASMIPGILLMISFSLITIVYLRIYSNKMEAPATYEKDDDTPISRYVIVVLAGFFIVGSIFGGIYTGTFTPTEAGAVGAFISLIVAAVLGKVNKAFFIKSIFETTKVTVMAMFIVVGASLFGRFISLSLIPRKIIDLLGPLLDYPVLLIIIIMVFYFFLFMFIEGVAVILMTVPIISPLLAAINVDPLWFGILLAIVCTIGMITPPVGISVYAVGGVSGISIEKLFRTSTVFAIIASIIVIGLLILFPELVTWLPSQMN
ncbi:TRAP transporter large permease [Alkalihalophilus lindianensis]|uniref:TRAP transporter large permease n=1 Tax=Alkalihalophilus lindianensis TaxID=1630542 RepID=A0ABU3XDX3_9BACI|nr:TRAP transporter large permease [Alkalihalophilus lindianensis]MDV2686086.1 TRAP transporter large permease [Alkalihalophilus lindianensis]